MADYTFPARYTPERLDYAVDWSDWLEDGETLASVTVTRVLGDLEISDVAYNDTSMAFWLTGGTPAYQILALTVTTNHSPPRVREVQASITCHS